MQFAFYLDVTAKAGNFDLGQQKIWLPGKPAGPTTPLTSFPVVIPEWRIKARGPLGLKITVSISLTGTVTLFQVG